MAFWALFKEGVNQYCKGDKNTMRFFTPPNIAALITPLRKLLCVHILLMNINE